MRAGGDWASPPAPENYEVCGKPWETGVQRPGLQLPDTPARARAPHLPGSLACSGLLTMGAEHSPSAGGSISLILRALGGPWRSGWVLPSPVCVVP